MASADKTKPSSALSPLVSVVVLGIAFIHISTVFVFIDRWFGLLSSPGIMNAAAFTALAAACAFTYRAAILTDPGRVPSTYAPDVEDVHSLVHEIKRKGGDLLPDLACFSSKLRHRSARSGARELVSRCNSSKSPEPAWA
ncbi:probable protein S-acyltransferase 16 [Cajanus cajan]|uniref:probable protein S-acyltransferase 16 n=1 Tax=Cajanus cajan TaxID=3821 RepID=UPI00098DA227|nr:probable protein S-acyltransferase 16 [Cajanus cajan]